MFILNLNIFLHGESFHYGYDASSDPATPLGLPNQEGGPYIYDGTPVPPAPTGNNNVKKWAFWKMKKGNIII